MSFKMKGPSLYRSPFKQDKKKVLTDSELEKKEDAQGVTTNINRKVMKDGPKTNVTGVKNPGNWQPKNRAKSDAEKKADAAREAYNKMTPAQKKKRQDELNARRKAFEATPEYKKRRAINDEKERKANANKK